MMRFIVEGIPVAQPRARHARFGNHIRTYYPSDHPIGTWKSLVILAVKKAQLDAAITTQLDAPVSVIAEFVFPRPKAAKMLQKPTKPDIDNLIKALLDGINNSGVWRDDAIVCQVNALKRVVADGELPHTVVEVILIEPTMLRPKKK